MSHDDRKFRPWYTPDTARWLRLSLAARGLIAELLRKWDDRGEIRAESPEDIAILLRLSVEEVAPALEECIKAGRLQWDGTGGVLRDPDFQARQRRSSAERMRDKRRRDAERVTDVTPRDACDVTPVTSDPVTGRDVTSPLLSSDLISSSSEGEPEREPPWFAGVVEAVALATMVDLRVADCWLRYHGHRAGKGKRIEPNDARYWLTTVMVPEARKEAKDAARQRERDARFKDHTPKYEQPTPGRSKDMHAELVRRLAEESTKKGAA